MNDALPQKIWKAALAEIEPTMSVTIYKTWFLTSRILSLSHGSAEVAVTSTYTMRNIQKYAEEKLVAALSRQAGYPVTNISYQVVKAAKAAASQNLSIDDLQPQLAEEIPRGNAVSEAPIRSNLNPRYTFESFVAGSRNRLAWAAAKGVAERPGMAYNPLYLYGGVGLGKTHLMQAIGNAIVAREPQKRVLYVSCEQFTNEYVAAVQKGKTEELKRKYRGVDIFLMDDIQFMAGKDGTQEEFFHTFNSLYQSNKQIVMTSDKVPSDIKGLEERLSSRFAQGMIADMQLPDLETRMAILNAKCEERGIKLPDEVVLYIADNIESNIRELEGALTTVLLKLEADNKTATLEHVQGMLRTISSATKAPKKTSVDQICGIVCEYYQVALKDIQGPRRQAELVKPRQVIMYLLKHEAGMTFPAIGRTLGGRDHTTAMHSVEKIEREMKKFPELLGELQQIKELFYAGSNA